MKGLTICLIIIYNIIYLRELFKKKNFFGLGTIVNFAINLNFVLYMMKWSDYIVDDPSLGMYILINSILIIFILIMIFSKTPVDTLISKKIKIRFREIYLFNKVDIYLLINCLYIVFFLIENYIGSGSLIPYLVGIDIHTYSAPLISFITRALFVMIFINFISWESFRKKRFLVFLMIDVLLFPVLRGGRINLFMAILQFTLFIFLYKLKDFIKNKKMIIIIMVPIIILIFSGILIGNKRVDKNLEGHIMQGQVTYEDHIKYNGPQDQFDILPWYYGYFPMSFANLDKTIRYIDENDLRTYGTYTIRPVLVGMFQFDNLFKDYKDIEYANNIAQYYTTAATVRTGFMEFYLDFGYLSFISIAIYALIGLYFYNSIIKNTYMIVPYAFFSICWFFMSFQNMMIDVTTLYSLIYIFAIYKFLVVKHDVIVTKN